MPEGAPLPAVRTPEEEVRSLLAELNACWLEGRPGDIAPFLHEDVVLVPPGFSGTVRGREAMLDGFRDFSLQALVLEYEETEHRADVVAETAVASYRFRMKYRRGGEWIARGRDVWVLVKGEQGWRAVWRTLVELEEEAAGGP